MELKEVVEIMQHLDAVVEEHFKERSKYEVGSFEHILELGYIQGIYKAKDIIVSMFKKVQDHE